MYTKLTGDSDFMALVTNVGTEQPDTQKLPYVSFGEKIKLPWFTFGKDSWQVNIQLDVWTALDDGDKDLLILAEMDRLFNNKKLTLPSYDNAWTYNELSQTVPEEAVQIKHVVVRYRTYNSLL